MHLLGISAFYHDSAACLLRDGHIIAAVEEERFSRKKHDSAFPVTAIEYCLRVGGIKIKDLDLVAFYEKPFNKFERILESHLAFAPYGFHSFLKSMPKWMKHDLWIKQTLAEKLEYSGTLLFPEHHLSHAAAAFYPSPFSNAAILTMDGVGEWATTSFGFGENNIISLLAETHFPHSLGLLYSAFTYYVGFKVNSGEYKLMGLAPYGQPKFVKKIKDHLIDIKDDGSFRLNMDYFGFGSGLTMTNSRFHKLFGKPPRQSDAEYETHYLDVACSIQNVLEEVVLRVGQHVFQKTRQKKLCMGGGVALNCVANGKLLREGSFSEIWIQPAAGDAGGALGAALVAWYQYAEGSRDITTGDFQRGSLLGPEFSEAEILKFLQDNNIPFQKIPKQSLAETAVELINSGNMIGWFQGRMEFGPRALGCRSILADARNPKMRELLNERVKMRERFRPFAAAVLTEKVAEYFLLSSRSPYMLFVAPVKKDAPPIPAVTHVDGSARIQTVDEQSHPEFFKLLKKFDEKYNCPIVINTSFNVRGEPMVCSPQEAYACFLRASLDALILGDTLILKSDLNPMIQENFTKFDPD